MPKLTVQRPGGVDAVLDVNSGDSVMEAATEAGVKEIEAICGGDMICSTCHVYVTGGPVDALPPVSAEEDEALGFVNSPREANSRLSCQLPMTEAVDGLVVRVPPKQ
jgi:2Fe-2S ferredoxin